MHMIGRKDLNCAEVETVTTSWCPTTVMTANGEGIWKGDLLAVGLEELEAMDA